MEQSDAHNSTTTPQLPTLQQKTPNQPHEPIQGGPTHLTQGYGPYPYYQLPYPFHPHPYGSPFFSYANFYSVPTAYWYAQGVCPTSFPYLGHPSFHQQPYPLTWAQSTPSPPAQPPQPTWKPFETPLPPPEPVPELTWTVKSLPKAPESKPACKLESDEVISTVHHSQALSPQSNQPESFAAMFRVDFPPQAASQVENTASKWPYRTSRLGVRKHIRRTRGRHTERRLIPLVVNPLDVLLRDFQLTDKPMVHYLSSKGALGFRSEGLGALTDAANHLDKLKRKQMSRIGSSLRKGWCQLEPLAMHIFIRKEFGKDGSSAEGRPLVKQMDLSGLQLNAVSAK